LEINRPELAAGPGENITISGDALRDWMCYIASSFQFGFRNDAKSTAKIAGAEITETSGWPSAQDGLTRRIIYSFAGPTLRLTL
jgi:hypothetical protein